MNQLPQKSFYPNLKKDLIHGNMNTQQSIYPEIFLSKSILEKISFLCNKINNVEWSGILFYKTEGHPINLDTFKVTAVDILPMHKGEPTYTEFEINESIIDAYDNNPELENCKMGIIHSHVNMDVFFSGTDTGTLHEYAKLSNYCLSFIVNNYGKMIAKVAYPIKKDYSEGKKLYKNGDGNWVELAKVDNLESFEIVSIDLKIVKEQETLDLFFVDAVDKVIKEAEASTLPIYNYNINSNNKYHNPFDYSNKPANTSNKLNEEALALRFMYAVLADCTYGSQIPPKNSITDNVIATIAHAYSTNKFKTVKLETKYNLCFNNYSTYVQNQQLFFNVLITAMEYILELSSSKTHLSKHAKDVIGKFYNLMSDFIEDSNYYKDDEDNDLLPNFTL